MTPFPVRVSPGPPALAAATLPWQWPQGKEVWPLPSASTASFGLRARWLGWVLRVPLNLEPGQRGRGQPHPTHIGQEWGSLGPKEKSTRCSQEEGDGRRGSGSDRCSPQGRTERQAPYAVLSENPAETASFEGQGPGPRAQRGHGATRGVKRYQTHRCVWNSVTEPTQCGEPARGLVPLPQGGGGKLSEGGGAPHHGA